MINTEKIFDMLPIVVELWDKLNLDSYRATLSEETKEEKISEKELGIKVFKYIIRNSAKIKEEIFELVATLEEKEVREIKEQSFGKTIASIKEIFTDKEAMSFFKQAI